MQKKLNTSASTLTQVQMHNGTNAIELVNLIHWGGLVDSKHLARSRRGISLMNKSPLEIARTSL